MRGLWVLLAALISWSGYAAESSPQLSSGDFSKQVDGFLKKVKAPGAGQESRDSYVLTSREDADALLRLFETSPLTPSSTQQTRKEFRQHPDDPRKLDAMMHAQGGVNPGSLFSATRMLVWSGVTQKRDDSFKKRVVAGVARVMDHDLKGPVTLIEAAVASGAVFLLAEQGWIGPDQLPVAQQIEKDTETEKRQLQSDLKSHSADKGAHAMVLMRELSVATSLMTRAAGLLR